MNRLSISDSDDDEYGDDELDAGLYNPLLDHRPSDRTDDDRFGAAPGSLGRTFVGSPEFDDRIDRATIAEIVAKLESVDDLHRVGKTICTALFDGTQDPVALQAAVTAELHKRFG